jgi:surface antigen
MDGRHRDHVDMRQTILLTALAALMLCAESSLAQNIMFLRQGPVAYLNETDKDMLRDVFAQALKTGKDGEKISWNNPDSGHSGNITVLDTHEDFGTTCRTVRTYTEAGGRTGGGIFRLCLADDGSWRFAPERRQSN